MGRATLQPGQSNTRRAIVKLLKAEGALDSGLMARRLRLTAMAVRQHLYELQREKLVTAEERPVPLGRPAKCWQLTREADRLFPDAYAELNVALIDAGGRLWRGGPETCGGSPLRKTTGGVFEGNTTLAFPKGEASKAGSYPNGGRVHGGGQT